MGVLHIDKFANAFVPRATPSALVGGAARSAVDRYSRKHGGLWVGGKILATVEALTFVPNGLNVAMHTGLRGTQIPLNSILSVRRECGWLTGVVVVQHSHGEFRFRCFGAKQVAEELSAYVAAV